MTIKTVKTLTGNVRFREKLRLICAPQLILQVEEAISREVDYPGAPRYHSNTAVWRDAEPHDLYILDEMNPFGAVSPDDPRLHLRIDCYV